MAEFIEEFTEGWEHPDVSLCSVPPPWVEDPYFFSFAHLCSLTPLVPLSSPPHYCKGGRKKRKLRVAWGREGEVLSTSVNWGKEGLESVTARRYHEVSLLTIHFTDGDRGLPTY